ncbi:CD1375 family protein [Paenibacillus sp. FA6]
MIVVMAALIVYGDITFSQVPDKSKVAVRARLVVLGYDENGQPIETV